MKIRVFIDSFVPQIPFPLFYVFWVFAIFLIAYCARHLFKNLSWKRRIWNFSFSILNLAGGVIFFFMILWGFNYNRVPVAAQLDLATEQLTLEEIKEQLEYQTGILTQMRESILELKNVDSNVPAYSIVMPLDLENQMRESLEIVLKKNNYPTDGAVNIRFLKPKGLLFGFNSSGIYLPFVGEGHIESALHPLQIPFVMAHEMAHGYGFGDEGVCNFWAYLSCVHSTNLYVRYTGHLSYWRYLASAWKRVEPALYQDFRDNLPTELQTDLNTINERLRSYPSIFGSGKNVVYDSFLRAQGIESGLENYNVVIPMVKSYWDGLKKEEE